MIYFDSKCISGFSQGNFINAPLQDYRNVWRIHVAFMSLIPILTRLCSNCNTRWVSHPSWVPQKIMIKFPIAYVPLLLWELNKLTSGNNSLQFLKYLNDDPFPRREPPSRQPTVQLDLPLPHVVLIVLVIKSFISTS